MSADALRRLDSLPRLPLAFLPTPVVQGDSIRSRIGPDAPSVLLKLDAWSGPALGGNKIRKLELVLGAMNPATDTLITCGGPQSNHCRVTAAVAARLGLRCILVVNGEPPDPPTGNSLLMRLFGAEIRAVATRGDRAPAMEEIARELRSRGGRPLVIPLGASTPLGSLGYVRAAVELDQQMRERGGWGEGQTTIFVASSSCGTLAGLALGFTILGRENVRLVGVSADVTAAEILDSTREIARGAAELLGFTGEPGSDLVVPEDRFVGEGYGIPTTESDEAARLFGTRAGLILDPFYTAKAAAGLLDWARSDRLQANDTALFWHTGGAPAVFT